MSECESEFIEFKRYLFCPPILSKLKIDKPLFLYLSVSNMAIGQQQHPMYFISNVLQGLEVRYRKLEKVALALVITA